MKIVCVNFVQTVSMLNILSLSFSKKGYQTFNKNVKWWRINHHWGNVTVDPILNEDTDNDSKTQ